MIPSLRGPWSRPIRRDSEQNGRVVPGAGGARVSWGQFQFYKTEGVPGSDGWRWRDGAASCVPPGMRVCLRMVNGVDFMLCAFHRTKEVTSRVLTAVLLEESGRMTEGTELRTVGTEGAKSPGLRPGFSGAAPRRVPSTEIFVRGSGGRPGGGDKSHCRSCDTC